MIGAMSCANCDQPVVRADEVITERYGSPLSSAVFAYELEVCDLDAWVYSATSELPHLWVAACSALMPQTDFILVAPPLIPQTRAMCALTSADLRVPTEHMSMYRVGRPLSTLGSGAAGSTPLPRLPPHGGVWGFAAPYNLRVPR